MTSQGVLYLGGGVDAKSWPSSSSEEIFVQRHDMPSLMSRYLSGVSIAIAKHAV